MRSPAAENGYRDGYAQGRNDARSRRHADPVRASRYRSGDHDYNRRYGPRDNYKREYRQGFQQGYERGYRDVRR
jgi:flagellar biosynthesis/type III secretory pathway protein FliH